MVLQGLLPSEFIAICNPPPMYYSTTLNKLTDHEPSIDYLRKLLSHLGKTAPDDEPLALSVILESNGLNDALWALRAVENVDRDAWLYACDCAQTVVHLNPDPRVQAAIDAARRYADAWEALVKASSAARAAEWEASSDAATWAAMSAAYAASAAEVAAVVEEASRKASEMEEFVFRSEKAGEKHEASLMAAARKADLANKQNLFVARFCTP